MKSKNQKKKNVIPDGDNVAAGLPSRDNVVADPWSAL